MGKNFDRIFILWIDRLVWLILMVVISNLAVEITGYAPGVRTDSSLDRKSTNINETNEPFANLNRVQLPAKDVEMIQFETIKITEKPNTLTKDISQQTIFGNEDSGGIGGGASRFFDSIFNIPIATLNAVNTLVQVIATSVQHSGKNIQSRYQHQQQHEINITKDNGNISSLAI